MEKTQDIIFNAYRKQFEEVWDSTDTGSFAFLSFL